MSALTGSVVLRADITITPHVQDDPLGSIDFGEGYSQDLSLITSDPAEFDRLAEAAHTAAQMLRDRIAGSPASPDTAVVGAR